MSTPKVPDPLPPPAKRPERAKSTVAEDIVLGGEDTAEGAETKKKGKRSLSKPTASASTGLAV